jgi:broad specificity phosphatase PhoE
MTRSKIQKSLVLIRHAHRDTDRKEQDNGLTEKGRKQAEITARTLARIFDDSQPVFLSSPKKRCVETLTPLAEVFNSKVHRNSLLTEQEGDESILQLNARVQKFLDEWIQSPDEVTIICSHGDWLPVAVELLVKAPCDFKKGGWAEIRCLDGYSWLNFPN